MSEHEKEQSLERVSEKQTYSQGMSEFWHKPLGNRLFLVHDPVHHRWRALGWQSEKLLAGIIANTSYDEVLHEQVLARAREYELDITLSHSTDSLLSFLYEITEEIQKGVDS